MATSDAAFIKQVQNMLNRHGANLKVDGAMGPKTRAALKAFQRRVGLPVNGQASRLTTSVLFTLPPMPQMRPERNDLGTGNTNFKPRLRQDATSTMGGQPMPEAPEHGAPLHLNQRLEPGSPEYSTAFTTARRMFEEGPDPNTTKIGPSLRRDNVTGEWIRFPPLGDWQPGMPPMSLGGGNQPPSPPPPSPPIQPQQLPQVAQQPPSMSPAAPPGAAAGPTSPPPSPGGFTPTPGNQGMGFPGLPPTDNVFDAFIGDPARAAGGAVGGAGSSAMQWLIDHLSGRQDDTSGYEGVASDAKVDSALQMMQARAEARKRLAAQLQMLQQAGDTGIGKMLTDTFVNGISGLGLEQQPSGNFIKSDSYAEPSQDAPRLPFLRYP